MPTFAGVEGSDRVNVVIYVRVSTVGQAENGHGLDVQERACRAVADRDGHHVVAVLREEGVSGAKAADERPALSDALALLSDGNADALVVATLDRLARSVTIQEAVLALAWAHGATVLTADQGEVLRDDPDDPWRTAMRELAGVMAGLERRLIVKRLRDGRAAKARAGGQSVGRYPFGWSRDGEVAREQRVLATIRDLRDAGETWAAIADDLNDRGPVYAPRHAPRWTTQTLHKVARDA